MTSTVSAPLHFDHTSGLHHVASVLSRLHRERLRIQGEETSAVHSCVANLVAACTDAAEADRAAEDLTAIGVRHPARAIVILADPGAEPHIDADISLQCALAAGTRVCAEMVRLHVGGEPAYHLTSIVTPLLAPDVPVHLWVVGSAPLRQPFTPEVVAMCERIIVDSGAYNDAADALHTVARELQRYGERLWLSDLAWERIRPWRRLLAQAFDAPETRRLLQAVQSVSLRSGASRRADALLLGGWLRDRLGGTAVALSVDTAGESVLEARVACEGGTVTVQRDGDTLSTTVDAHARRVGGRLVLPHAGATVTEEAQLISRLIADANDDPLYRSAAAAATTLQEMS